MPTSNTIHARFRLQKPGFTLQTDLTLTGQGITVIQGPSGSGKTTLLRCIAGLEHADDAYLSVNGHVWQQAAYRLPAHQRPIGYVFQDDRLFEHLNARKNILFGSKDRSDITDALMPVIEVLGIAHLLHRKPADLSGGERQRVAIARALAVEPEILLMDEPVSALDLSRRREILKLILKLHALRSVPIIYVTHDRTEADLLADQYVFMNEGRIIEATPTATTIPPT